jgi:ubiquinone/menaquinone biosynthesis C-methylase UbiE
MGLAGFFVIGLQSCATLFDGGMRPAEAQSLAVKRAEVEFHSFASLGEPERALARYAEENHHRAALIRKHLDFIGPLAPFLEIGANAGHTSYLLANDFAAHGFALDISADSLRYGLLLMERWGMTRAPVRIAGDALNLPFRDESLRFVMAFQMLSQFMDIESVFIEVKRVLAPGGIFLFAEEPLKRMLTLGLYRAPYRENMKPWERRLFDWGLLGYVVKDVIGAGQEESFGIRQNHSMGLKAWRRLVEKHFAEYRYEVFVREHGWAERLVRRAAVRLDPYRSDWRAAQLLGGTLAAICRKTGSSAPAGDESFEKLLRCPDCGGDLRKDVEETLRCSACGYSAPNEGGVYTLLRSAERKELYPGDREDIIDFALAGHEKRLLDGWYKLEGVSSNRYRWIGPRATARLVTVSSGKQRLRIRGHAPKTPVMIDVRANGEPVGSWTLDRTGLFVLEAGLPHAPEYTIEIRASPTWTAPPDDRLLTVNLSRIRLIAAE